MNKEQIRYYTQSVGIDYWNAMDEGTTMYNKQGAPRRSTIINLPFSSMTQRWEVVDGMLKPTDKLSPNKKTITHKMDMT